MGVHKTFRRRPGRPGIPVSADAVSLRCSMKIFSAEFHKICKKTTTWQSLFIKIIDLDAKTSSKRTPLKVIFCELCELRFSENYFCRTSVNGYSVSKMSMDPSNMKQDPKELNLCDILSMIWSHHVSF